MSLTVAGLEEVLQRSKAVGFLGPGPVTDHIAHAQIFIDALDPPAGGSFRIADLGAGGGVPSLPLLVNYNQVSAVLVDSSQKRSSFLTWAVAALGLSDRVEVWRGRAEDFAHNEAYREGFDVVVARSFGPPSWTFECAIPLLKPAGRFLVSEPPGGRPWPTSLNLATFGSKQISGLPGLAGFARVGEIPAELPRPAKVAKTKPLFTVPGT